MIQQNHCYSGLIVSATPNSLRAKAAPITKPPGTQIKRPIPALESVDSLSSNHHSRWHCAPLETRRSANKITSQEYISYFRKDS